MSKLKTIFLFFFCTIYLSTPTFLQVTEQDSLIGLISKVKEDSLKAKLLIDVAVGYKRSDRRKQYEYGKEAYRLLEHTNYNWLKVQALHVLGDSYLSKEEPSDSALIYFEKGLSLSKEIGDLAKEADYYNGLGTFYHQTGIYDKAFKYYQQAIEIAEQEGLQESLCRYQNNMALILMMEHEYDRALKYFQQALEIAEEIDNKLIISALLSNIGVIYNATGAYDLALEKYTRSLEVRRMNNDKVGEVLTICNIGNNYRKKGLFDRALIYQKQGLALAEEIDFNRGKSTCIEGISLSYFDSGQYEQAIRTAKQGLEICKKTAYLKNQVEFTRLLAESYAAIDNYLLAYKFHYEYTILNDSLTSLQRLRQINELETKYRFSQKEAETQLIREKQIRQEEVLRRRNIIIVAVLTLLVMISLLAFNYYHSLKQKQQYNQQLQQAVEERTVKLNQSIEMLKDTNRELENFVFIASHDLKEPLRSIVSFNNLIQRKLRGSISTEIQDYFDFINNSGQQMYHLIESSLEFSKLSKIEIVNESVDVNQVLSQVEESLKILIQQRNVTIKYKDLPTIESNPGQLFLVFKNLIENGIKYNDSEMPEIMITYQKNQVYEFSISDNGIGIPNEFHDHIFKMFKRLHDRGEYTGSGLGLAIVRKILKRLGGSISLNSKNEKGSTFIVKLPIIKQGAQ